MKSTLSSDAPALKVGSRTPTPAREWLRLYVIFGALATGVMLGLNALGSIVQHGRPLLSWDAAFVQVLNLPLCFVVLAIYLERKVLRHRPRRLSGTVGKIQIRNRLDGKVIITVEGERLRDAEFVGANLQAASLWGEQLEGVNFTGANLQGAYLRGAVLDGAGLSRANLRGATLSGASLCNADLRGADLREAFLDDADLTGAIYDRSTRWGPRAKQKLQGCVFVEGDCGYPIPAEPSGTDLGTLPLPAGASEPRQTVTAGDATCWAPLTESQATP